MNLNFNEICRLCLRFCEEYVDLNQTNGVKTLADDLVEKIRYCYYVQIDVTEDFPTKVCFECIQVLSFFYTAKKNVIISDKLLRDILFVKKKIQEETKTHKEENVTSPDIIEIKADEQKNRAVLVVPPESEPIKSNENSAKVLDVELICHRKCNVTSENSVSPLLEPEKEIIISSTDKTQTKLVDKPDLKVNKKKKLKQHQQNDESSSSTQNNGSSHVTKLLTPPNSNLDVLVKFKDLKKEQCQRGKVSKFSKDKTVLRDDRPLKENVVKEIGTVIDTNNILSPDVKRTRKSISARERVQVKVTD